MKNYIIIYAIIYMPIQISRATPILGVSSPIVIAIVNDFIYEDLHNYIRYYIYIYIYIYIWSHTPYYAPYSIPYYILYAFDF